MERSLILRMPGMVHLFLYLQLLDVLTTLVGFKMGASEASPFIRLMMHAGPALGLMISKAIALAIGGACILTGRRRLMRWVAYWYSGLVAWNLMVLLAAPGRF
ncbi:MAG: DUF5658 family protein [Acidobacteriia bacterium]|nr:DUF5658 family protein [Terriglobia bacterium]